MTTEQIKALIEKRIGEHRQSWEINNASFVCAVELQSLLNEINELKDE